MVWGFNPPNFVCAFRIVGLPLFTPRVLQKQKTRVTRFRNPMGSSFQKYAVGLPRAKVSRFELL